MSRQKSRTFTDVELEFMQIIWALSEATPEDINRELLKKGRSISIGSIRNVLAIMINKRYITRRKNGRAFLYTAKIHKEQAGRSKILDLIVNFFDGSESLAVSALLNTRGVSKEELEKIRKLIDSDKQKE